MKQNAKRKGTPKEQPNQLATMLRQLESLVTGRGPRVTTTVSLSASERALFADITESCVFTR